MQAGVFIWQNTVLMIGILKCKCSRLSGKLIVGAQDGFRKMSFKC